MSTTDVNDFLLAGGTPAAKFDTIGTLIKGTVVAAEKTQQIDFKTKKPKFFDDGNPMMQAVITLQTDERDPSIEDDDGQRKVYVKGQMQAAVRDAVKASGAKLDIGGTLAVQFYDEENTGKGNPKKLYKAQYKPGAPKVSDDLLGSDAPSSAPAANGPAADDLI